MSRVGVETALTLSKSIPVKSQVPIQVLLEEERTEPERSPWEELPSQTYIILISASPIIGLTRASLMKDRILHYCSGVWGGLEWSGCWGGR